MIGLRWGDTAVACPIAPCGHPDHVRLDFTGFSGSVSSVGE